jgi:hypothetical protein
MGEEKGTGVEAVIGQEALCWNKGSSGGRVNFSEVCD